MKKTYITTNSLTTLILFFLPFLLFSQENNGKNEFEPRSGQAGKDVVWVPTPQALVDSMLDLAKITPSDFLIDLGSGDGRTVITAAKKGVSGIGVEYNPDMVELSRRNAVNEGVNDIASFIKADLFEYDFSRATVLTLFLLPEINKRLRPLILEMKPGTRVVSNSFTMQDWEHDDMVEITGSESNWNRAYLWIVPAKVEGIWKFTEGVLELIQKFQMVTGKLTNNTQTVGISDGRLKGNAFTFSADGIHYNCQVNENMMKGTASKDGKITEWQAERLK